MASSLHARSKLGDCLWNSIFVRGNHYRFLSTTLQKQNDKAVIVSLRKKTGYAIKKCSEALKINDNDATKAEAWLHEQAAKEGWSKAGKLAQRTTGQGLVGVLTEDNYAVLVELGCETDFVARNEMFQELLVACAKSTIDFRRKAIEQNHHLNSFSNSGISHVREMVLSRHLNDLPAPDRGGTLEDYIVSVIGKVGENIRLKRALAVVTEESNQIFCASHGNTAGGDGNCLWGSFASAVFLKPSRDDLDYSRLGKGLAHHAIGMNPKDLNDPNDGMLNQEYLLNDSLTVSDICRDNDVELVDFIRYSINE